MVLLNREGSTGVAKIDRRNNLDYPVYNDNTMDDYLVGNRDVEVRAPTPTDITRISNLDRIWTDVTYDTPSTVDTDWGSIVEVH